VGRRLGGLPLAFGEGPDDDDDDDGVAAAYTDGLLGGFPRGSTVTLAFVLRGDTGGAAQG
jgi:hypothetical protein